MVKFWMNVSDRHTKHGTKDLRSEAYPRCHDPSAWMRQPKLSLIKASACGSTAHEGFGCFRAGVRYTVVHIER